ncbi:MAG: HesA/MoeB/ThiF family protein [Candidatus Aenigmatarchaeota archaeon]
MDIETYELFSRQIPYLGVARQEKILNAKVAIIGAGGLGSHVSEMIVRLGFGFVRIIDRDLVEESNLHRTCVYQRKDIGKSKAFVLSERLGDINKKCKIESVIESLHDYNADELLSGMDVVIDCSDNMETRYVINKFCVNNKIPWVYGAVLKDEGFSSTFASDGKPCFECLYPQKPKKLDTCAKHGVISPIVGMIASWQVMEAIKIVTGMSEPNYGRLFRIQLERPGFELLVIKAREDCLICGKDILKFRRR